MFQCLNGISQFHPWLMETLGSRGLKPPRLKNVKLIGGGIGINQLVKKRFKGFVGLQTHIIFLCSSIDILLSLC